MPLPKVLPKVQKPNPGARLPDTPENRAGVVRVVANRYSVENKLGSGAFGTAFLVTDRKSSDNRKVLKQIAVAELQPDETVDAVREARLLAKLDHPYIVKFHDSFTEGEFFCIITEFCEGGDLDAKVVQWRESGRKFEESLIVDWFIQLTTAVKYIHERRVLHRDLKSRNIFLKHNLIKLGDFGISRILMGTNDLATTFTGTPYYMSPEVLKHDGYNTKSDVWSLGCVLYELCTLQHAFRGQNLMAVMYKIVEGEQPRLPDHFNPQLCKLFLRMLSKDPKQRPSAVEILQEPFIQDRLENLRGKMSSKAVTSSISPSKEAEAIARALSPVKKKSLISEERVLTPRQRLDLRKRQRAEAEAERIKKAVAQNFNEGRMRFKEHRKKQMRVVPPWVEEHPDVFSDPNFSLTQLNTPSPGPVEFDPDLSFVTGDSMSVSGGDRGGQRVQMEKEEEEGQRLAWEEKNGLFGKSSGSDGSDGSEGAIAGGRGVTEEGGGSRERMSSGHAVARVKDGVEGGVGKVGRVHGLADPRGEMMTAGPAHHHGLGGVMGGVMGGALVGRNLEVRGGDAMDEIPVDQVISGSQDEGAVGGASRGGAFLNETHRVERDEGMDMSYGFKGGGEGRQIGDGVYQSDRLDEDMIPVDPQLAETHYSQYNDFESESEEDKDEDFEALLVCIEDALDLSEKKAVPEPSHDELSPFTPLARERRIAILKEQGIQTFGSAIFSQLYDYLRTARYSSVAVDEKAIMSGLRQIVPNVRDCFIIDQLVFLEKQAETVA